MNKIIITLITISSVLLFTSCSAPIGRIKDEDKYLFTDYYITNNLDTVKCRIDIDLDLLYAFQLEDLLYRVTLFDNKGKKKFRPGNINSFVIRTDDGSEYKFVSLEQDKTKFYRAIVEGEISLYYDYKIIFSNIFGNSAPFIFDVFVSKDNKLVRVNLNSQKDRVRNFFKDNSYVLSRWDYMWVVGRVNLLEFADLIKEYNETAE